MGEAVDYFSNHSLKLKFPWRLYHRPIVEALARAVSNAPGPDVLNVGSGPFFELEHLPANGRRYTACDIDPRAIALAKRVNGDRLARTDVTVPGAPLPYEGGSFDLVASMDVIEHLPNPAPWVAEIVRVLRPGGRVFLTTPNYGSGTLDILERTVLEAIARVQGFSRRALHPSRFGERTLGQTLERAGLRAVAVEHLAFDWVLAACASKPAA